MWYGTALISAQCCLMIGNLLTSVFRRLYNLMLTMTSARYAEAVLYGARLAIARLRVQIPSVAAVQT